MSRPSRPVAFLLAFGVVGTLAVTAGQIQPAWSQAATPPVTQQANPAKEPIGGPRLAGTGVIVQLHPGAHRPPTVTARTYLVADLESGEILAAKAPHERHHPASTLKMLTGLALLPLLDKHARYRATLADDAEIGSAVGIIEGHTYTIDQLFLGMFLESGNDAAHALATAAGGTRRTVAEMRRLATTLQARDTTVVNDSGLDANGQLSSAYDLALIARAGMQRPDFRKYVATRNARFPAKQKGKSFAINNQNELLTDYPGAIGIKTGYTTLAKNTFVAAATRDGRTLLVALMHGKHGIHEETAKLLDWGFANATIVEPVGILVDPTSGRRPAAPGIDPRNGEVSGGHASDATPLRRLTDLPEPTLAAAAGFLLLLSLWAGFAVRRARRRRAMEAELAHLTALKSALNAERERLYDIDPAPAKPPTGHLLGPPPPAEPPQRRYPTAGERPPWDRHPTSHPRTAPPPLAPPRTAPPRTAPPLARPPTTSPRPYPPDDERRPPPGRYR
jgi:D-alanyl-D-alanine carboxypeptidase (penicillin-binding protein 5/6)